MFSCCLSGSNGLACVFQITHCGHFGWTLMLIHLFGKKSKFKVINYCVSSGTSTASTRRPIETETCYI